MDHVAIMKKQWGLIPKILSGRKTIESRWYQARFSPWNKIKKGDTVYFKNSGNLITLKTKVKGIIQFSDLNPNQVKKILYKYGPENGLGIENLPKFYQMFKGKRYCILIFLEKPQTVKPFDIDKTGFGAMSAWISIPDIQQIKKHDKIKK